MHLRIMLYSITTIIRLYWTFPLSTGVLDIQVKLLEMFVNDVVSWERQWIALLPGIDYI